ncbi:MAG: hypothetical protein ACTICO_08225 [Leuconostoc citreum]
MIEIGHNLQHAIEFGMYLSVMVAVTYTWIVWKKGYEGHTTLRWFN